MNQYPADRDTRLDAGAEAGASPSGDPARTAADQVASYVIDYIRRHRLPSGASVPSESRLARELSVSRGVVREALRSLDSAGIVNISNGRAPRVDRLTRRPVSQFLQHGLSTDQLTHQHVFDARATLEIRAAALAARHRTDEDVQSLRQAVADMRSAGAGRAPFIEADIRFHDVIGHATSNPLFDVLGSAIRESFDRTIRAGLHSSRTPEELTHLVDLHGEIAEAIAGRRPALGRRLMRLHFAEMWRYAFGPGRPSF